VGAGMGGAGLGAVVGKSKVGTGYHTRAWMEAGSPAGLRVIVRHVAVAFALLG